MYRRDNHPEFVDFYLPFGGKLSRENRWVKLAGHIEWERVEEAYEKTFSSPGLGAPAMNGRIALGALIIKERLGITDRETVEQIFENPYLQYFLGFGEYQATALFDASMMVHFRKRLARIDLEEINRQIVEASRESNDDDEGNTSGSSPSGKNLDDRNKCSEDVDNKAQETLKANGGKLIIDATCTPADITYPTDLKLLGDAREKSEEIIDVLYAAVSSHYKKKPRTYRQQARKEFTGAVMAKKLTKARRRKAIGKQLGYVGRNLKIIDELLDLGFGEDQNLLLLLKAYQYKCLLVIRTVYEQQSYMHKKRVKRVDDRIVSISQPHVRPIVRGKTGTPVEFGAKLSVSCFEGYCFVNHLRWDNFHDSHHLPSQVEAFRKNFGHYPASVHADQIYRTRENRKYCQKRGIRLTGAPLGRPKQYGPEEQKEKKSQRLQDERDRIAIEGKFGNAKRKGSLQRIMAKLSDTSQCVIQIGFIVLNLDTWLRRLDPFWAFLVQAYANPIELTSLRGITNALRPFALHQNRISSPWSYLMTSYIFP